jgi:hypothetical protein
MSESRIPIRAARWRHAKAALRYLEAHGDTLGAQQLRREMELLAPYWRQKGITKVQAVEMFYRDHPEKRPQS